MISTVDLALTIVAKAFLGKTDKGGNPYYDHLLRVARFVNDSPILFVIEVAYLHDLLEDCPEWSAAKLRNVGFPNAVVDAVVAITKVNGESYFDYITRVKSNPIARVVKLADLRDNMDITRLKEIADKDIERLKKYHWAFKELSN